jgi:hypothetical protein
MRILNTKIMMRRLDDDNRFDSDGFQALRASVGGGNILQIERRWRVEGEFVGRFGDGFFPGLEAFI